MIMKKVFAFVLLSFVASVTAYYCNNNQVIINLDPYCTPYYYSDFYYNDPSHHDYYFEQYLPSERYLRRQLYWLYRHNPRSLELKNFPVDYFIRLLTDHIKVLENKIAQKKNGLRGNAMIRGTICTAFSLLWGYAAYSSYGKRLSDSSQDTIGEVMILSTVSAFLALLAGTQFDRVYRYAERLLERLDRDKQIRAALETIKFSLDSSVK